MHLLLVALGGALGSVARYLVGLASVRLLGVTFPYGTLIVNVVGCLAIGLLVPVYISPDNPDHMARRVLLVTGVLGGFTTFSAFGLETVSLYQRSGPGPALLNIGGNVVLGLGAVALGFRIGRIL